MLPFSNSVIWNLFNFRCLMLPIRVMLLSKSFYFGETIIKQYYLYMAETNLLTR